MRGHRAGGYALAAIGVGGLVVAYVTGLAWALGTQSYDVSGAFLLVPFLTVLTVPFLVRLARADGEPGGLQLLLWAFALKISAALPRYWMLYGGLYGRGADGELYHDQGVRIAASLHAGLPWETYLPAPGTGTMEIITGYLYWLIGPTRLGGFFVYSWFGFLGLLLFTRAFRHALPAADARRYSLLVLFLPSLLFWPSSIGKEAWMMLVLGVCAYGAARLLAGQPRGVLIGLPVLAVGVYGAAVVRPHMALLVFAGVFVGFLARPSRSRSLLAPVGKLVGLAALVVVGALLLVRAQEYFGVDARAGAGGVTDVLDKTQSQTSIGGSAFEAEPVRSPLDLPMAVVSVLLRPFPWEARNAQSLLASAESLLLLALLWRGRRSLVALPRLLRREPYLAFVTTYCLLFVVAFSTFSNFGILTRQRVQVFPFVLVLLALPAVADRARRLPYVPARRAAPGTAERLPVGR